MVKNREIHSLNHLLSFQLHKFVTVKGKKRCWMPEAGSKIILQKKGCFREEFLKKTFWNSPFLQKCPWIGRYSISNKTKEKKENVFKTD